MCKGPEVTKSLVHLKNWGLPHLFYCIPLKGYTITYLSISLLMKIWFISTFYLFWTMLQWTFLYICLAAFSNTTLNIMCSHKLLRIYPWLVDFVLVLNIMYCALFFYNFNIWNLRLRKLKKQQMHIYITLFGNTYWESSA